MGGGLRQRSRNHCIAMDNYEDIGILLRSARLETRMPIEQAAQALHIRVRYLEALEEGRLDAIPGLTYTKGYLYSYANFLDLDSQEILRRFEAVEVAMGKRAIYFPQVLNREKTPNSKIIWGSLIALLLIYLLWWAVVKPPGHELSMVDNMPKNGPSIMALNEVACLHPQEALYPPCTMAEPQLSLLPLSQHTSIMELAH